MPPRLQILPKRTLASAPYICHQCRHASLATAPASSDALDAPPPPLIARHPPTQPPSHKRPEYRKTQLHRQYQSLLRSSPLMLLFQHNNLKAIEWMGIRRELALALASAEKAATAATAGSEAGSSSSSEIADSSSSVAAQAKLQTVQTSIFGSALKVVELWEHHSSTAAAAAQPGVKSPPLGLSRKAYFAAKNSRLATGLEPLLSGPLAVLTLPTVSPAHLKAALAILAPNKQFPAPRRRAAPGYFEPAVQNGVQKLMLLGARVEGKVFDMDGARWVGGIDGGIDGLRAQLVGMLMGFGGGLTSTLEAASRSLYLTVEGRRGMMEEEEKKGQEETQA